MHEPFPLCRQCGQGELVPLSDFGAQGAAIHYKAWVCTNPRCSFNLKVRGGDVYRNEIVTDVRETGGSAGRRGGGPGDDSARHGTAR